jgi:5-(carboxyamino)imidazole ribonucleotide synthase
MMGLAGIPLGIRFRFLDPDPDAPAGDVGELITAPYEDEEALAQFARGLDAATYEFENVPSRVAGFLCSHCPAVFPPPKALEVCQDRLLEKRLFQRVGLETPRFAAVASVEELRAAVSRDASGGGVGLPCVLKTRRFGYDGKGQAMIHSEGDIAGAFEAVAGHSKEPLLIVESFVEFSRELSLICVRSAPEKGGSARTTRFYPLVENRHTGGILRVSVAPAPGISAELQRLAETIGARVLDELDYKGVLTLELFQVGQDASARLLGNELAPRVHNSGHWTIEGSACGGSQFENHLRAILGWPLGMTTMREGIGCAAMLNLIGPPLPHPSGVRAEGWSHPHLYAKASRTGRKVGHISVTAKDRAELETRIERVRQEVPNAGR